MKSTTFHIVAALAFGVASVSAQPPQGITREIGRTTEREVKVVISSSFGRLAIARGEPEKIVIGRTAGAEKDAIPFTYDYSIRNRVGYLDIAFEPGRVEEGRRKGSFNVSRLGSGNWVLNFSNAIPITFDVELGVSRVDFDLTDLQVKDFNLSCGASDVTISFDKPNTIQMNELNIECGVGKFEGRNLGNANFKRFRFEGGLGTATLDFSGTIKHDADIDIAVGLGLCTIYLPKEVGARIFYEKSIVSRIDYGKGIFSSGENLYFSDNYASAAHRVNVRIEAGLGSVRIRRE